MHQHFDQPKGSSFHHITAEDKGNDADDEDESIGSARVAITRTYHLMGLGEDYLPPRPHTIEESIEAAQAFRDYMTENAATELCAACGCYCPPVDMRPNRTSVDAVMNLDLLLCGLPQDRENGLPRAGLTSTIIDGMKYCIEPAAYHPEDHSLDLCHECYAALEAEKVPEASLVRIDIGPDPLGPDGLHLLPPLTWIESWLVSPFRLHQTILICFGKSDVWNTGARYFSPRQKAQQGHSYSKLNPALDEFTGMIPFDLDRIPEFIQVVFCSWRKKGEEPLADQLQRMDCAKVRGPLVVKTAYFLIEVRSIFQFYQLFQIACSGRIASLILACPHSLIAPIHPSLSIQAWKKRGGLPIFNGQKVQAAPGAIFAAYDDNKDRVPQSIIDNAIYTENEDQARSFASAFQEGRTQDYTKKPWHPHRE